MLLSWLIVGIGLFSVYQNQDKILGIDFRGGEELIVSFDEMVEPAKIDELFSENTEIGEVQRVYRSEVGTGEDASRLVLQTEPENPLKAWALLQEQFPANGLSVEDGGGETAISGSVSEQIKYDAVLSVLVALLGILLRSGPL